MRLRKEIITVCFLCAAHAWGALAAEAPRADSSYGTVYAALEDDVKKFEIAGAYRGGLSNPYFYTHGISLGARYFFGEGHYFVGLENVFYITALNTYASDVKTLLGNQGLDNLLYEPKNHTIASFGIVPLAGLLNFFSKSVVPFDVAIGFGVGRFMYNDDSARLTLNLGADFTAMITKSFGAGLGINFIEEKSDELGWLFNVDASLRLVGRF